MDSPFIMSYQEQCLETIVNQTYQTEIILVSRFLENFLKEIRVFAMCIVGLVTAKPQGMTYTGDYIT